MSDALYATRLRWCGGRGVAKLHGRSVVLVAPPVLCGVAVHAIDYTPEIRCLEIQRAPCEPRDDMTAAEVIEADALLLALVTAAAATTRRVRYRCSVCVIGWPAS